MDRRSACLTEARLCRERANADPSLRKFWLAEAAKWKTRADEELDSVAMAAEARSERSAPDDTPAHAPKDRE
jgi:uncharacterized protein YdaU (DUF1376 family)